MHLQVFEDSSGAIVMCFDSHKAEAEGESSLLKSLRH